MNLDQALGQFDIVEANLGRLERVWLEMVGLIPDGIAFMAGSPESMQYEDHRRAFGDILVGLPPIDSWSIEARPLPLATIAQDRLDASELGEVPVTVSTEAAILAPGEAIEEYRFRLRRARSKLVRARATQLLDDVDRLVGDLNARVPDDGRPWDDDDWKHLVESVSELERLVGPAARRMGRWNDLARHLSFGQRVDLSDIANHDWPSVRPQIEAALYTEQEPLPVLIADLGAVAASAPSGRASTALSWDRLDPEGSERLVYNLISDADGYENAKWLTRTNAPDRGRDLSVDRVHTDSLSGVRRERVIVQCKHLLRSSVALSDVNEAVAAMSLWQPPPVDVLVIATSGRFTTDAVTWIERHNLDNRRPVVEMWPESHLETLLAQRPGLVAELRLRAS